MDPKTECGSRIKHCTPLTASSWCCTAGSSTHQLLPWGLLPTPPAPRSPWAADEGWGLIQARSAGGRDLYLVPGQYPKRKGGNALEIFKYTLVISL